MHDERLFQNPSASYRGKPFWSWNGLLAQDELDRQIECFRDMGMGGYFCHSRTGLATPYLGEDWFRLINGCAEKGAALGMETWLYDEDRWPSGTAGGLVTENPAYRMRYIRLSVEAGGVYASTPETIAAFAVELDGLSFVGKTALADGDAAAGRTVLRFTLEEMAPSSFYNGNTYVDTMNLDATRDFLRRTHERYRTHCGASFGGAIRGIFTDEPHRGAVMCGFSLPNADPLFLTPYTDGLFEQFEAEYGTDLRENLPELFLRADGEKVSPVKWQYMELIGRLFLDNFLEPIQAFCRQNRLQFTGHLLHEDSLTAQACMAGSLIRAYERMDVPGVDVLTEGNRNHWIAKQLQSAARQLGKPHRLSELYGCTGWQMNFNSHKQIGDWQALFGINLRCHHLSWYTMKGEAKRDYPASIGCQSAWYREYAYVEDYFSRIHVFMEPGRPVCDLLVVNPVESLWSMIHPGWAIGLTAADPAAASLERMYEDTFRALCGSRIDFDYGDEDFLARLASVDTEDGQPVLRVGLATYRAVLVTGMLTIRGTTLRLLEAFAAAGGRVVVAGGAPADVDAVPTRGARRRHPRYAAREELLSALDLRSLVSVRDEADALIDDIYAQVRRDGDEIRLFLLNINRETAHERAAVRLDLAGYCEQWDARSGEIRLLASSARGEPLAFTVDFPPGGELLLLVTPENRGRPALAVLEEGVALPVPAAFEYRLEEPNVCVLDIVDYAIEDGPTVADCDVLRADQAIRGHTGLPPRGGEMVQPWFDAAADRSVLCGIEVTYRFFIRDMPERLSIAHEYAEDMTVLINGHPGCATPTGRRWVDACIRVAEADTAVLRPGENTITIKGGFRRDTDLEAIYLLGGFGVELDGLRATLTKLPGRLSAGDLAGQGLPFYSGRLACRLDVPSPSAKGGRVMARAVCGGAACIVFRKGHRQAIHAFAPYESDITALFEADGPLWMEYIFTRRNTFGPMHHNPPVPPVTGPESFLTEGEQYMSDAYSLIPQHIAAPVLTVCPA